MNSLKGKNGNQREAVIYTHPLATLSINSKGRTRPLGDSKYRTEFQRDIHRIIYSQPFRRLKHKTQVFYRPENDHICTRMEHSIQVASAARTIARVLELNEDLAEAIGLGHDLGHAPFGHHGETVLNCICEDKERGKKLSMQPRFQHEVHGYRVAERLAQFEPGDKPGLALTYEVLDGIISHCGEDRNQRTIAPYSNEKELGTIRFRADAKNPVTLEGCIVRMVDRVSYAGKDMDDGLMAGMIDQSDIPKDLTAALGSNNGEIVDTLIQDIIENSIDADCIDMSQERFEALRELIKFNYKNIYHHPKVQLHKREVKLALTALFDVFVKILECTDRFQSKDKLKDFPKALVIGVLEGFTSDMQYDARDSNGLIALDFIAGFTDHYTMRALDELFIPKPVT